MAGVTGGRRIGSARRSAGGQTEAEIMAAIRVGCADIAVLWRNHVGTVTDARTRRVHTFGFGKGSADLVGARRSDGRFVAIEVKKTSGRVAPEQLQWLEAVARECPGSLVGVARSVDDARRIISGDQNRTT